MKITRHNKEIDEDEDYRETEYSGDDSLDMELTLDKLSSYSVIRKAITTSYPVLKPYIIYSYNASSLYLFWICLHYLAANMYTYYCVPSFFQGFIMSPFLVSAPHCRAIRWVVHNGGNTIDNMWIMLATWLCSKLIVGSGKEEKSKQ